MIGPNTIVFFIPFSVPLHEIKFTVDGLKNWLNQKKIKEVPYLCDSVTQQWMFWVHREKNLIFYSWNCQFWFWWSDGFLSSLLSPSLVKKTFWSSECLVFFFVTYESVQTASCLFCEGILIWLCLLTMRRDKLHLDFQTPETQSPE